MSRPLPVALRRFIIPGLVCLAGFQASTAHAGPEEQQGSGLGGGFIELLFTGSTRSGRPVEPVAPPAPAAAPMPDMPPLRGSNAVIVPAPRPMARAPSQIATYSLPDNPLEEPHMAGRGPLRDRAAAPVRPGMDPRYEKQEVAYNGPHKPGTLVIDTPSKYLYLVLPNGRALRYGIGVGRPGFEWAGVKTVSQKREWPDWRPPSEMLKRRPDLPRYMAGGPENPLGARAMYLGSSLYRIHGTNEPETIGRAVSSGCIRMRNKDIVDLYERVRVGAKVIVI